MERADGRPFLSPRPLLARLHVNDSAPGSSYVELGGTRVFATVYGPHEPPQRLGASSASSASSGDDVALGSLVVELRYAPFSVSQRAVAGAVAGGGAGGAAASELSSRERLAADAVCRSLAPAVMLARLPHAAVEVALLVLQSDGGEFPACVIAASLALADAGVEQLGLVSAARVARLDAGGVASGAGGGALILDPTADEERRARTCTTVADCRAADRVVGCEHSGALSAAHAAADVAAALEACRAAEQAMRGTLLASEMARDRKRILAETAAPAAGQPPRNDAIAAR